MDELLSIEREREIIVENWNERIPSNSFRRKRNDTKKKEEKLNCVYRFTVLRWFSHN